MAEPVLADTSAWIESFRSQGDSAIRNRLSRFIEEGRVVVTGLVVTELLRGACSPSDFETLEEALRPFPYIPFQERYWRDAAWLAYRLERRGVKTPTHDLLIASVAIHLGLILLHKDRHFTLIAKHTDLKLAS